MLRGRKRREGEWVAGQGWGCLPGSEERRMQDGWGLDYAFDGHTLRRYLVVLDTTIDLVWTLAM